MPRLRFRTQQAKDDACPDMQGCDDDGELRVLVEHKFWAGLTENQPVSYLKQLAKCNKPTLLLMVCPEARKETLWRELNKRLKDAKFPRQEILSMGFLKHA
jgi:hypothetical protein